MRFLYVQFARAILLTAVIIGIPTQQQAIQLPSVIYTLGTLFKKNISNPTLAYIFPATVPILTVFGIGKAAYFSNAIIEHYQNFSDPDEDIGKQHAVLKDFIRSELRHVGVVNPEKIVVAYFYASYAAARGDNLFLFDDDFRKDCIKAGILHAPLTRVTREWEENKVVKETWHTVDPLEASKLKKELKAVVSHEGGHLKHKDTHKLTVVTLGTALATSVLTFASLRKINAHLSSKILQGLVTATSTVPLCATNLLINRAYHRYREQLADESIPQHRDYVEGAINFFEKSCKKEKELIQKGELPNIYENKFAYWWNEEHPTNQSRLNRFKERLEQLPKE